MPVSSPQVRFGLLASAMCVAMAELPETDTATLNARAEQFEAWCARVLDHLPCMQTLTTAVLLPHRCARVLDHLPPAVALGPVGVRHLAKADRVWGLSLLEFAFAAEMKAFLGHPHCRGLVRTLLHQTRRLGLPHHTSSSAILIQTLLLPLG